MKPWGENIIKNSEFFYEFKNCSFNTRVRLFDVKYNVWTSCWPSEASKILL